MEECLILTMDIGKEVLRALREVKDGLQVDDLRTGLGHRRERLGQELQVSHVMIYVIMFCYHKFLFALVDNILNHFKCKVTANS